jgi:predicted membrane protein
MGKIIKIYFGVFLVMLGSVLFLEQFGLAKFINIWFLFGLFWPLLLLIIGVMLLSQKREWVGLIFIAIGIAFLVSHIFNVNILMVIVALILMTVGVFTIMGKRVPFNASQSVTTDDQVNLINIFWGTDSKLTSQAFTGGNIACIFGGVKYDLRDVQTPQGGAKLEIECVFGGVELIVSPDTQVVNQGAALLGAWENKTTSSKTVKNVIELDGMVVFGGVEIRN